MVAVESRSDVQGGIALLKAAAPLTRALEKGIDAWAAAWPRRPPSPAQRAGAKVVSHRGLHDRNRRIRENTIAAFRACVDASVWGVELDVQWTRDLEPVVIHDPDTRRVHGDALAVAETDRAQLQRRVPDLPGVDDIVSEFGGAVHLMVELKADSFRPGCIEALAERLAPLEPVADYHLLSLIPELLDQCRRFPRECLLPVAQVNTAAIFDRAIRAGYGGVAGHFLLLTRAMRRELRSRGMGAGAGFVGSRNALLRELELGTDWIFSNHAAALQQFLDDARRETGGGP